jgi:hypothetical protein
MQMLSSAPCTEISLLYILTEQARSGGKASNLFGEQKCYPYHNESVEEFVPHDALYQSILQQSAEDPAFEGKILFGGDSCFSMTEIANIHNKYVW